jgi:hypothetical protein
MKSVECYKTTNNKFFNCPPRMSDGRHFTDYRPSCDVNNLIISNNKTISNFDYRMFLIENADKLMDINRMYTVEKNSCGPCKEPYNQGTMLPEKNLVQCDANTCKNSVNVLNGLGQGRKYSDNTDCGKDWSYPKNVPASKCAQSQDIFDYYNSEDVRNKGKNFVRYTSQSGGNALSGGDPSQY